AAGVAALALLAFFFNNRGENDAPARPGGPENSVAGTQPQPLPQPPPRSANPTPAPVNPATQPVVSVPPPTAYSGTVFLTSVPENAEVHYRRQFIGVTPMTYPNVPPGPAEFEIQLPRYRKQTIIVNIEPGK